MDKMLLVVYGAIETTTATSGTIWEFARKDFVKQVAGGDKNQHGSPSIRTLFHVFGIWLVSGNIHYDGRKVNF